MQTPRRCGAAIRCLRPWPDLSPGVETFFFGLTLDGQTLPAGTYTITTSSATVTGSGASSSPNFAGSATLNVTGGTINLAAGSGSISVAGKALNADDETTLDGYAGTIYKAQGATYDEAIVIDSPAMRASTGYVALTRHRDGVTVVTASAMQPGQETWMAAQGGLETLTPEQRESAQKSFANWQNINPRAGKRHDFAAPQCGNQNLGSKQQLDLKLRFLNRPARTRPLCLLEDAVCCVFE